MQKPKDPSELLMLIVHISTPGAGPGQWVCSQAILLEGGGKGKELIAGKIV